jgi:hypothetical protein
LLLILGGIGYFVWKKYDDGKPVRLVFSLSASPDPAAHVAGIGPWREGGLCARDRQHRRVPALPRRRGFRTATLRSGGPARAGPCRFTNLLDPALNLTARSLPLELELQNKTGKIFAINIEEEN